MKYVTRAFLRYLPRRRSLSLLQLLGIACGVAAVVGMVLSARTALASFARAVEFLQGQATHALERPAGPLPEKILSELMGDPAVESFSPLIDRRVPLLNGEQVRFLGLDPFLDRAIRPALTPSGALSSLGREEAFSFLLGERSVLLDGSLARRLGLGPGGTLRTARGEFSVAGTFPNPGGEPLVLLDIFQAQKIFGLAGKVDRVDLILSDEGAFRSRWGAGFRVRSSRQHRGMLTGMLRSYRLNLEALSLFALFVGMFLVYNTAMFAVVSRKKDAGILRSLGARRGEIISAFLAEVLILGALGGAGGGALGYLLSRFLTEVVGETISHLYFFLQPSVPPWSWSIIPAGALLGAGASLIGALFPLRELTRLDPAEALHGRTTSRRGGMNSRRAAGGGLAVMALGGILLSLAHLHVYVGFAGAFVFLVGASLLTGLFLVLCAPLLRQGFYLLGGTPGKIAAGNIRRNLSRTAVATAAFMVALSMSVGLGAMIGSFRHSLVWWLGNHFRADIYIPASDVGVPEDFYLELLRKPGVAGIDPYRSVQVLFQGEAVFVTTMDAAVFEKYARFAWVKGGKESWEGLNRGAVIVSESFHRRFGRGPGDLVVLQGIRGPEELLVAGVFYDYTTEHGLIMMDRSTYLRVFQDHSLNGLGIFLDPKAPRRQELLEEIRRQARSRNLPVASPPELHGRILEVFDATFAVTRSMRLLAVVVAFFGIAGALLTLFLERQREFGIYRALGFSTAQVAGLTLLEGLGMGAVSFLLSTAVGTGLAFILTRVINLQSFHWTIFLFPEWGPYLLAAATALLASLGAAAYPVWKICRTYPQMQIREE
ncbi:MAG: FtsX-like permease family protein [Deltaproteobacteria bacterium]|nr:FtsX-like permease family protein [Deltaproteobacteria bacterium]